MNSGPSSVLSALRRPVHTWKEPLPDGRPLFPPEAAPACFSVIPVTQTGSGQHESSQSAHCRRVRRSTEGSSIRGEASAALMRSWITVPTRFCAASSCSQHTAGACFLTARGRGGGGGGAGRPLPPSLSSLRLTPPPCPLSTPWQALSCCTRATWGRVTYISLEAHPKLSPRRAGLQPRMWGHSSVGGSAVYMS